MSRLSRVGLAVVVGAAVTTLLAGCGSPEFTYEKGGGKTVEYPVMVDKRQEFVAIRTAESVFKVPRSWTRLSEDEFLAAMFADRSIKEQLEQRRRRHAVMFDADPQPSVAHLLNPDATRPALLFTAYALSDDERDRVSLQELRNLVVPIDGDDGAGLSAASFDVLSRDDQLVVDGGLRGSHVRFEASLPTGTVIADQIVLTDPQTRIVYLMLIGCSAECFVQNVNTINEIATSWTFEEN